MVHLDERELHSWKTLERCSSLYACHVEETKKHTGKDKNGWEREEMERRVHRRESEGNMIRLSLVINLSEAVRTF